jgi:AcrR family transcriptional regulator
MIKHLFIRVIDILTFFDKMSTTGRESMKDDGKREKIKAAAYAVMLRYGPSRMTLDDIAKEAGMSRPAIYLHYKNKDDVFRDVIQSMADLQLGRAAAFDKSADVAERLMHVITYGILEPWEGVLHSPHSVELMNLKAGPAADLGINWHKRLVELSALAIKGKQAEVIANIVIDAVEAGIKRGDTPVEVRKTARTVTAMAAAMLA